MRATRKILLMAVALGLLLNPLFHLHSLATDGTILQGDVCAYCIAGGSLLVVPDPPAALPSLSCVLVTNAPSPIAFSTSTPPSSSRAPPLS